MSNEEQRVRRFRRNDGRASLHRVLEMPEGPAGPDFWTVVEVNDDPDAVWEFNSFEEAWPATVLVTLRVATPAEIKGLLHEREPHPSPHRPWWQRMLRHG